MRVRKLEQSGHIVGYRAIIARAGRGSRLEAWADICFKELTIESRRAFEKLIDSAPDIVEAHRMAGRADYVVRFCGPDIAGWNSFRDQVEALVCDAHTRFNILVEVVK